ncbi:hypothetical protein [Pseudomonas auratipiscis]|uniref:Uncharacterized protein n=1 Tax=Pseudomonas auratipiscis TaxID=3115853 RepID=A0AB35WNR9_9PSED|nr:MULTISPECIES: hypothetical protein [unclassified Pseudomonas]MEE1864770.1 hypothetical protein [Pseudomonas sp. 120P]MEE1956289.1 hypothetical protein [Pseudomonas sp. 119P]
MTATSPPVACKEKSGNRRKAILIFMIVGIFLISVLIYWLLTPSKSFTFTADLPPDFTYSLIATYVPATGETCSVPGGRNTKVAFNRLGKEYKPISEVLLFRTVSGCSLMLYDLEIDIIGISSVSQKRAYTSSDYAKLAVGDDLPKRVIGTFNDTGLSEFYGQCQWLFRTVSRKRNIVRILSCRKTNELGKIDIGKPFSGYTLDQLPGKAVRLKIKLADVERPYLKGTWVKVPEGWKRCMGESFEDQYAFCRGNNKDFSTFRMIDGRICTIYPGCTESKDSTP